jgi:uncharacterized protein
MELYAEVTMMSKAQIHYCEKPGAGNTDAVLHVVAERLKAGDIHHVVVATNTGSTALRAAELIKVPGVKIYGIHHQSSQWRRHAKPETHLLDKARELGVAFVPDLPPAMYFREIQGESADTLRHLGQGTKVAVEVVVMATQTGLIAPGQVVVGVAGTGRGCDSAIVCTATTPQEIGKLFIREILAKPIVPA